MHAHIYTHTHTERIACLVCSCGRHTGFPRCKILGKANWQAGGEISRGPLTHPSGSQHPGSGGGNCSAAVLREMLAEELWECYEGG